MNANTTQSFLQTSIAEFRQVVQYKELLKNLTLSELKIRYKRSILGFFWIMLNPLLMMIVMYFVFSKLFTIENYFVYLISGIVLWNLFSQTTTVAKYSFIAKANLIKKVFIPKAILPLSNVFSEFINFCFALIPLFIIFTLSGFYPTLRTCLLPFCIVEIVVFSIGVSLFLSTMVVFFHDVNYIYDVLLLALMYLTPIFWPADMLEKHSSLMKALEFNPLYHYLRTFRGLLYDSSVDPAAIKYHLIVGAGFAVLSFCIGACIYVVNKDKLVFYL